MYDSNKNKSNCANVFYSTYRSLVLSIVSPSEVPLNFRNIYETLECDLQEEHRPFVNMTLELLVSDGEISKVQHNNTYFYSKN